MEFLILGSFTAFLLAFQFHIYFIHCQYYINDTVYVDSNYFAYTCNHHSSCGDISSITYPFRLKGDPESCGHLKYELSCINNQTIVSLKKGNFAVKSIDYYNSIIRVSHLGVEEGNYCSSIPRHSISLHGSNNDYSPYAISNSSNIERIAYLSCEKPVNSHFYVNTSDCIIIDKEASGRRYSYVVVDKSLHLSDLATSCAIDLVTTTTLLRDTNKNFTYVDIHKQLVYGIELSFSDVQCDDLCSPGAFCRLYNNTIFYNCYYEDIDVDTDDYSYFSDIFPYTCNHHSSCGEIVNITYPFRLKEDPKSCGEPKYELACINNQTILNLKEGRFAVKSINYTNSIIRVTDLGVQESNYSSIPRYSFRSNSYYDDIDDPYAPYVVQQGYQTGNSKYFKRIAYIRCEKPMNSLYYLKLNTSDCISALGRGRYCYVVVDLFHLRELSSLSCVVDLVTTATLLRDSMKNFTYVDIHKDLVYGFELGFYRIKCEACIGKGFQKSCYCSLGNNAIYRKYNDIGYCPFYVVDAYIRRHFQSSVLFLLPLAPYTSRDVNCSWLVITEYFMVVALNLLVIIFAPRMLCGCPCFLAFLIYKWRKRNPSMDDSLEKFLQHQNDLMPIRYSYSQIKKMCRGFHEKLGAGGFGSVFKGKLKSRQFVAVKMLNNPKANAQDFINEVATIGKIHHVNVIRLVGFCAEGQKRALVYEFMHKGSLDKYICSQQGYISLGWKKLYEISLGIARGIEYLHRGCDMQILHFDIKPHNVLLDENFMPKISDFGLAKSYPTGNSIVSLTAARGTIGYIAPELIYKRIGGVSSKADIYSFGMLLMEMTGKKKKQIEIASSTNKSTKTYFPMWVYHEIVGEVRDREIDEVEKISRKMIIVALWCIQIRPCDRPLMRKVIEMLEGGVENLKLPPEPTFNIEDVFVEDVQESINPVLSSFTLIAGASDSDSDSVALMVSP